MRATGGRAGTQARLVRRRAIGSRKGDARGGEATLKSLHKMFNGDWHLVLAAYNGGLGRLQRAMKNARTEDFWQLRELPLPAERDARIRPAHPRGDRRREEPRASWIQRPPGGAGRIREGPGAAGDRPSPGGGVTGQTIDEVQALNPELRRWTTPLATPNYEIKVPAGTASTFASAPGDRVARPARVAASSTQCVEENRSPRSHRKLSVSRTDLAEANKLSICSPVRTGQEPLIPRAPTGLPAASASRSSA